MLTGRLQVYLAVGTEVGRVRVYTLDVKKNFEVKEVELIFPRHVQPPFSPNVSSPQDLPRPNIPLSKFKKLTIIVLTPSQKKPSPN